VDAANEFGRTAKLLGARLAERLAAHGHSVPRFQLLVEVSRHGPLRLTELGSRVGISQGTASTLVEALVRDRLIDRNVDPVDGRAVLLTVTRPGRAVANAWLLDYERVAVEIFGSLPAAQRGSLATALRKLRAGVVTSGAE